MNLVGCSSADSTGLEQLHLVMVGTPNAGSIDSLMTLVEGKKVAPLLPNYQPALLGTMPSVDQLLPRARHGVVVDATDSRKRIQDLYDPDLWERMGWGLADPRQDGCSRCYFRTLGIVSHGVASHLSISAKACNGPNASQRPWTFVHRRRRAYRSISLLVRRCPPSRWWPSIGRPGSWV